MSLEIGNKAPHFSMPAIDTHRNQTTISLADYSGKKLVLYFYPKDDTPGCTSEAIEFTAQKVAFDVENTEIIGVSADNVPSHEKFSNKHELGITLGSDETQQVLKTYGVWVEKNMYGRQYMGIERATYLIDEKGKILQIWRKVKVKGHVDTVLQAVQDSS